MSSKIVKRNNLNMGRRAGELSSLKAIYGKEWKTQHKLSRMYSVVIKEASKEVNLQFTLPEDYPLDAPPSVEISGPALSKAQKYEVLRELNDIYLNNVGEPVLFAWIEKIRAFLQNLTEDSSPVISFDKKSNQKKNNVKKWEKETLEESTKPTLKIIHGEVIEDRKSTFQGHMARISKPSDVKVVVETLLKERKLQAAKHNVIAWRCGSQHDCDDDGERLAGGRLLKLLELSKADNVVVVVTRWFGGIQIGSDRFRHYNNAAKDAMSKGGVIR